MTWVPNVLQSSRTRQTIATVIVCISMMNVGFIAGWLSPSEEQLLSRDPPVKLNSSQFSWVMGAANLGSIFISIPAAFLMDWLGRRNGLFILNTIPAVGWLYVYFAADFTALFIARLLTGTWIGIAITMAPIYLGEVVEPKYRSFLCSFINLMYNVGIIMVFTVGEYVSFRPLAAVGFSLTLFFWLALFFVPESPYFYTSKNDKKNALGSLKWLRGNQNIDEEFNKIEKFLEVESTAKNKFTDIFATPGNLKAIVTVLMMTVFLRAGGLSLLTNIPIIVPKKAFYTVSNDDCGIIIALVYLLGGFRLRCMSRFGNRPLLMISGMGCGICMTIMTIWEYLKLTSEFVKHDLYWVPFICLVVHAAFCSLGMAPIVLAIKGEVFPTEQKAILSAIATICGNSSAFLILKFFVPISLHFGTYVNFIIPTVACFGIVLITYFCLIETEGKSLQDIQNELNSRTDKDTKPKHNVGQNTI